MKNNITKFNYEAYKGQYDEKILDILHSNPASLSIEQMRAFFYGFTFTEDYVKFEFPDEICIDYWRRNKDSLPLPDEERGTNNKYVVNSLQEKLFLQTIESTGDGKTPETALCVIDEHQEYEYIGRVFPYCNLEIEKQSYRGGVDCITFEDNEFGIKCLYFDVSRRFEVGYH